MQNDFRNQNSLNKKANFLPGYQILNTIGKGTFGKVKLALHIATKQNVAIKILQKNKIINQADKKRVERQIQILRKIRHPNIIQLYQIISTNNYIFLITEYASGGQLFQYIVKNTRLSQTQASRFLQQILNAIQYLHKLGITHRDLKPQNLLLDSQNNIKVVDFGLSNIYSKGQLLKTACGSPCYAAPEMVLGKQYYGLQTDIWSCGIILYAMCCGYLPFDDPSSDKLYKKIAQGRYELPGFTSDILSSILTRILNVNPQKRARFDQIRGHQFCKNNRVQIVDGIIIGVSCIPIEGQIKQQLQNMNMDVQNLQESIMNNKHNNLSATYYLLLEKHLKKNNSNVLKYYIQKQLFINKFSSIDKIKRIILKNMNNNEGKSKNSPQRVSSLSKRQKKDEYRLSNQDKNKKIHPQNTKIIKKNK